LVQNLHLAGSGFDWGTTSRFLSDEWPETGSIYPGVQLTGYYETKNPLGNHGVVVIPEPASLVLLGTALLISGLALRRRRHIASI
jgi:hypothetical protein